MKTAVVSIYKSEAVEHIKRNNLEDVTIICDQETFEMNRGKFDEVVILSVPMGLPQAKYLVEMLTKLVVKTTLKPKEVVVVDDEPVKEMSFDLPEDEPMADQPEEIVEENEEAAPKVRRKRTPRL
jgi:hypothetical protein